MKVTSRGHYGLRVMTQLALAFGEGPLSLSEVARREHLSLAYLEQLVALLRKAGLVEGSRGQHGGYWLTRAPSEITVGEVVRALEGPIAPVECVGDSYVPGTCAREPECLSRSVWARVRDSITQVLDGMTLADVVRGDPREPVPLRFVPRRAPVEVCSRS
jgi:Rrf2 family protein